jgi:hypothetical protein
MQRSLIAAVLIALAAGALGEVQGQETTAPTGVAPSYFVTPAGSEL